jgi:hypothetical protein
MSRHLADIYVPDPEWMISCLQVFESLHRILMGTRDTTGALAADIGMICQPQRSFVFQQYAVTPLPVEIFGAQGTAYTMRNTGSA